MGSELSYVSTEDVEVSYILVEPIEGHYFSAVATWSRDLPGRQH